MAAALSFRTPATAASDAATLRIMMQSDLRILDPIWASAYIVRDYGYMVYDTLFATDEKGDVRPQMVDTYEISADRLTYTFKLRPGLLWHDNQPVTSFDVVPSLTRWGARDAMGQVLMTFVKSITAKDESVFEIKLNEPTSLLIPALGKPSSAVPFMMPKRVAETDPYTQIKESIGSGPFRFVREEWRPGDRSVFVKFEGYRPRSEAPSGHAGAKIAKVDRIEWRVLADYQQAMNALLANELDIITQPSHDLVTVMEQDPSIKIINWNESGYQYYIRFNHVTKPFDNPKARQAVLYALNQEDFLMATVGNPKYYRICKSMFGCNTPFATTAGMEDKLESNFAKSQQLLKEAGYDGEPVVILSSSDIPQLINLGPVAKSLLERGGFKVDLQAMDFQTIVGRRVRREPAAKGGWNLAMSSYVTADIMNPIVSLLMNASGERAAFGWPSDAELERLRMKFARAATVEEQREAAEAFHRREAESPTHVVLGELLLPAAARSNVRGWLKATTPVFWNIEKAPA